MDLSRAAWLILLASCGGGTLPTLPDSGTSSLPCPVSCRPGYQCVDAICVPICDPECPAGLVCSADRRCVPPEQLEPRANPCGGQGLLDHLPGDPCGPCASGRYVCRTEDSVVCVDPFGKNACGGCAVLAGRPETECAANKLWTCQTDGTVSCAPARPRNACGGREPLAAIPGRPCGACGGGHWQCASVDQVICADDTTPDACDCRTGTAAIECGRDAGRCTRGVRICGGDGRYSSCVVAALGAECLTDTECGAGAHCVSETIRFFERRDDACHPEQGSCPRKVCRRLSGTRGCTSDADCAETQGCAEGFCHDLAVVPEPERCNGADDDCDGRIDNDGERFAICGYCPNNMLIGVLPPGRRSRDLFCIDAFEASRPDSTATVAGRRSDFARAESGVLPWTAITATGAIAACRGDGYNQEIPGGVPERRLCRIREWRAACSASTGPYPYGADRVAGLCNDRDGSGALEPVGSRLECSYAFQDGRFRSFDMVGNAAEWIRGPDAVALAGGSFEASASAPSCDTLETPGVGQAASLGAGFRCCSAIAIEDL